uniref:DNA mismatch repair protein n=1 Tax=Schistosoma mansoni TaxID=6183 RepID=A0A5K4F0U3_SCHMA
MMRSEHYAKMFEKYKWKKQRHPPNSTQSCPITSNDVTGNRVKQNPQAVLNSSSIRSSNLTNSSKLKSHVLLSIVEGRGQSTGEIGLATIDIYSANVELSQFRDTSSYSRTLVKLLLYCPTEIIIPKSGLDPNSCMRKLVKILLSLRNGITLNGVNRNHFNDKQGLHYLRRLCHPHYIPSIYAIKEKFYALSALSALLNYAEEMHGLIYAHKSMKFSFTGSVKSTMIDFKSANHLRLVRNNYDYSAKDTLYSAIDFTSTASGARLLRANLLEPPCDLETILNRQASVRELISSPETLFNIQNILRQFPHIDSLLSLCVQICSTSNLMFDWNNNKSHTNLITRISNKSNELLSSSTKIYTQDTVNHSPLISTIKNKSTGLLFERPTKSSTLLPGSSSSLITPSSEKYCPPKSDMIYFKKAVNIQAAESRITKVIAIKYMLDLVKLLYNAMGDVKTTLLRTYKELLHDSEYEHVLQILCTVLHKDVRMSKGMLAMRTQKCFAIKEGLSVVLDVTRKAYSEQLDDITNEVSRLSRQYNLPLRISHNKARGFYIQIPEESLKTYTKTSSSKPSYSSSTLSNNVNFSNENIFIEAEEETEEEEDEQQGNIQAYKILHTTNRNTVQNRYHHKTLTISELNNNLILQNLPDEFKKSFISKNVVHCTTDSLIRLNGRIKGSLFEVYHIADQIISDLITGLHPDMALFYRLSEVVAGLDLLASFAKMSLTYSLRNHFVCPIFSNILGIKNGRNIVTDEEKKSLSVANHTYASPALNFHVITGPPMCGKTTYLRQIAYIQILAQIGSFVPAEFTSVRLTDQIFFHTEGQDDIILGESSFVNEIRELTYILQNFSRSSIILIDGLCHNTDPDEVEYLNWAICEALLEHKAFTFLATNRYELTSLASFYPNVENYYFSVEEEFLNIYHYEHHNIRTLNRNIYETPYANNSNSIEESPLVHSFSDENYPNTFKMNHYLKSFESIDSVKQDLGQITFTYKLNKGISPKIMYGIKLARLTALPQEILDRAEELLNSYIEEENIDNDDGKTNNRTRTMSDTGNSKQSDKNISFNFQNLQRQVLKTQNNHTDLDVSIPTESSHCTTMTDLKHDISNLKWKNTKKNGYLTVNDRLEHELFRQLQIISKAYQTLNTDQHLSNTEKEDIQHEISNYLKFLEYRYQKLLQ